MQALEHGSKLQQEELHLQELGLATLTACFVNANRDPKKGEPAKPTDFFYFQNQALDGVNLPTGVCNSFFSLVQEGKMPGWVVPLAPISKLKENHTKAPVALPRAWHGEGILLLKPKLDGKRILAGMAIADHAEGVVPLIDIDSGATYEIYLSEPVSGAWILDAEFTVASVP